MSFCGLDTFLFLCRRVGLSGFGESQWEKRASDTSGTPSISAEPRGKATAFALRPHPRRADSRGSFGAHQGAPVERVDPNCGDYGEST